MQLGWFQKRRLARDGYVQLRGVVPPARIEAALRAINQSLGAAGLPPDRLRELRARTFCPELVSAPAILALYDDGAQALAESAIGRVRAPGEAQIALRFPQAEGATPVPHIDGMYTPDNGVPAGTLQHFTGLLGVFLSDVATPRDGNFTVWPGSHRLLAAHFRQHGIGALAAGGLPALALPQPRPLLGRAGDVVLAHYALAHAAGPNLGPHVRYAVFFRLHHADHDPAGIRSLTRLWSDWDGMQSFARAGELRG